MIDWEKVGTSIVSPEAARARLEHFKEQKPYFESLEEKRGNHLKVKGILESMQSLSSAGLIVPRLLQSVLKIYLDKYAPSQQNKQLAKSTARVFALLSHEYYHAATKFNVIASFFVSPSVWKRFSFGRQEKESGLRVLIKMGVIINYKRNLNQFEPNKGLRITKFFQFNMAKVEELYSYVKALAGLEEDERLAIWEGYQPSYVYRDFTFDDVLEWLELRG